MIKEIFYKLDVATWMALLDAWKFMVRNGKMCC